MSYPLDKGFTREHLGEFKRDLNSAVLKDMRYNKDNISVTVLAVDITRKESEYMMERNYRRIHPSYFVNEMLNKWIFVL